MNRKLVSKYPYDTVALLDLCPLRDLVRRSSGQHGLNSAEHGTTSIWQLHMMRCDSDHISWPESNVIISSKGVLYSCTVGVDNWRIPELLAVTCKQRFRLLSTPNFIYKPENLSRL